MYKYYRDIFTRANQVFQSTSHNFGTAQPFHMRFWLAKYFPFIPRFWPLEVICSRWLPCTPSSCWSRLRCWWGNWVVHWDNPERYLPDAFVPAHCLIRNRRTSARRPLSKWIWIAEILFWIGLKRMGPWTQTERCGYLQYCCSTETCFCIVLFGGFYLFLLLNLPVCWFICPTSIAEWCDPSACSSGLSTPTTLAE
jgi:hypothetical protein